MLTVAVYNVCLCDLQFNCYVYKFSILRHFVPLLYGRFHLINQSISEREICRAPLYDSSKYILESFSECTLISNVMKVGRKSVPGGWTGVEEATFIEFCSCSWQNVSR